MGLGSQVGYQRVTILIGASYAPYGITQIGTYVSDQRLPTAPHAADLGIDADTLRDRIGFGAIARKADEARTLVLSTFGVGMSYATTVIRRSTAG